MCVPVYVSLFGVWDRSRKSKAINHVMGHDERLEHPIRLEELETENCGCAVISCVTRGCSELMPVHEIPMVVSTNRPRFTTDDHRWGCSEFPVGTKI